MRSTLSRLAMVAALAVLAGACSSTRADPAPAPLPVSTPEDPGYVSLIAFRDMNMRAAPNPNSQIVFRMLEGTRFDARVKQTGKVWYFLDVLEGPEGYVFGVPFQRADGSAAPYP